MNSACRRWLAAGLALAASCAGGGGGDKPRSPVRRVILITCDTLRADHLGLYGYPREVSPHLDAFAREALVLVFERAYASGPLTRTSVSSMLTGRLPDEIGVSGGTRRLMPAVVETLAEVLRAAGVPTAAVVSNWVLRRPDPRLGAVGVAQGFEHYDDRMTVRELHRPAFERLAPETTDAAIEWIRRRTTGAGEAGEDAQDADRFFLWVHYQDPHGPYTPPPGHLAALQRPLGDEAALKAGRLNRGLGKIPAYQVLGQERRPEAYRMRYDGEIHFFDQALGRLLDWLRAEDLYEDSLIVFSSDHGESMGEHDYWFCHGENVHQELVRVPLIVRYPAGLARPRSEPRDGYQRVDGLASHLDLWATVLEAFDLPPRPSRGTSLLTDELPTGRVLPQTLGEPGSPGRWLGLSDGRYRLVVHGPGAPRLFDVLADPGETRDLAAAQPGRVRDLQERYQEFLARLDGGSVQGADLPLDAGTQQGLEQLGYADGDDGDDGDED